MGNITDDLGFVLNQTPRPRAPFTGPQEAVVISADDNGVRFSIPSFHPGWAFGPARWSSPAESLGFPPPGTRCMVAFVGDDLTRPWVVQFDSWPAAGPLTETTDESEAAPAPVVDNPPPAVDSVALAAEVGVLEDRVGSLEAFTGNPILTYRRGSTADAGAPTLDGPLFFNTDLGELWIPGGSAWYKTVLTAVAGVSGGSNAPTNFTAVVNSDNTDTQTWTLPTPPAGTTITAVTVREKFQSPGGVAGMPLPGTATTHTSAASSAASTREYYVTCTFSNGIESAESNHVTNYLPFGSTGDTGGGGSSTGTVTPATIAKIGSINFFSVDIGLAGGANVSHTESEIAGGFVQDPYFTPNAAGDAVQMQCFANSGTTSGSAHPRTEFREVKSDGTTKAAWTAASGNTHRMMGTSTITHLPADSESTSTPKPWTCFGQIHDAAGDVVRLQCEGSTTSALALKSRTHSPNGSASTEVKTTIQASYTVGGVINWMIEVVGTTCNIWVGGTITWNADNTAATYSGGSIAFSFTISGTGFYFKAGDYQQFTTASGDGGYAPSSYARVELKNLYVQHTPAI